MASYLDRLLEGLYTKSISRREFIKYAGAAGVSVGMIGTLLAACGGSATPAATETAAATATEAGAAGGSAAAPTGKVVFLSAENLLGRWDPFNNSNLAHLRMDTAVYDYLVMMNDDGTPGPGLATEWSIADPKVWEFKLRQGVKFHNDKPFTAKDVKASLEYSSKPEIVSSPSWAGQVEVEIVDDYTVRVHTPTPYSAVVGAAVQHGQSACIAPAEDIENPDNFKERMIGTGPFKWVSYGGEETGVEFTANTDYWQGAPGFKDYVFKYVGDSNTRLAALQTGEAQIIDRVEPDQVAIIQGNPDLKVDQVKTVENKWLAFRLNDPPLDNKKLRHAIAHAIDRDTIVKNILLGSGEPCTSFITTTQDFYVADPNFPSYNPERAKQLLAEAGYPNGEGLEPIILQFSVGFYPKTKEYGEFIVQNLAAVGIKSQLKLLEVAAYNQANYVHTPNTIQDHGWFCPAADPHICMSTLFYSKASENGGFISGVKDPNLDKAIDAQAQAMDPEERKKVVQTQLVPALIDVLPEFPLFTSMLITGYTAKLKNFQIPATSEHRFITSTRKTTLEA